MTIVRVGGPITLNGETLGEVSFNEDEPTFPPSTTTRRQMTILLIDHASVRSQLAMLANAFRDAASTITSSPPCADISERLRMATSLPLRPEEFDRFSHGISQEPVPKKSGLTARSEQQKAIRSEAKRARREQILRGKR